MIAGHQLGSSRRPWVLAAAGNHTNWRSNGITKKREYLHLRLARASDVTLQQWRSRTRRLSFLPWSIFYLLCCLGTFRRRPSLALRRRHPCPCLSIDNPFPSGLIRVVRRFPRDWRHPLRRPARRFCPPLARRSNIVMASSICARSERSSDNILRTRCTTIAQPWFGGPVFLQLRSGEVTGGSLNLRISEFSEDRIGI